MKDIEELENGPSTAGEAGGRRKKRGGAELSLGDVISGLSTRDWRILIDLYLCRFMPQSAVVNTFFLDSPELYYEGYEKADPDVQQKLQKKNRERALRKSRRRMGELRSGGLIESTNMIADETEKPSFRRGRVVGETWYYLTGRGLRVVEIKIGVLEESRLSKLELDMERAKKEHFWELAKVYLDLRYAFLPDKPQFSEWDWHPALTVYSDYKQSEIRPDAVFRLDDQVFYIELDRSTEPVQRSPFHTDQISIEKKLERYRNVIKVSTNKLMRNGIIAFIVPEAIYETRLTNIRQAAKIIFPNRETIVYVGRTIGEIIMQAAKESD